MRLSKAFFLDNDTPAIAQKLLGKLLVTKFDGQITSGRIVETEAYRGPEDKACHAYNNRYTKRTKVMFEEGGKAYITLCYGIHHLFNVVTGEPGEPQAVLIRAIEPIENTALMLERRNLKQLSTRLTAGPGALSKALNITTAYHGSSLLAKDSPIWLEAGVIIEPDQILASPRVGIGYAEEWITTPWRFRVKDSEWTSPAK